MLTAFTGSPYFPGGMGIYNAPADTGLGFEKGPSEAIQLQWGTYYDAADQAGLSRIWGGIHPPVDDFEGRRAGAQSGQGAWTLAQKYFNGSITNSPIQLAMRPVSGDACEIRYTTQRGFYYKLQSSTDLNTPFTDEPGGFSIAYDTTIARTNTTAGDRKLYRVIGSPVP